MYCGVAAGHRPLGLYAGPDGGDAVAPFDQVAMTSGRPPSSQLTCQVAF